VQPPGAAFDVGHGSPELSGAGHVFITHGHLDHAAGVPFLLSQRSLQGLGSTKIFCPGSLREPLEAFIESGARLEGRQYDYGVHGLRAGDRVSVGGGMLVEAFATSHVAPSLGYHLIQSVSRLRPDFGKCSANELAQLRSRGVALERTEERLWLSYTGDTSAESLDSEPRLFEARMLLLECTFLRPEWREKAALFGHIHFDDICHRAGRFTNETIVLHHLSRRFSLAELRRAVERDLPDLAARIRIVGEEGERLD
jgi:ribonuclease Z